MIRVYGPTDGRLLFVGASSSDAADEVAAAISGGGGFVASVDLNVDGIQDQDSTDLLAQAGYTPKGDDCIATFLDAGDPSYTATVAVSAL